MPRACLGIALSFAACSAPAAEPATFDSIGDLWAGFDPRAVPLEIETVKAWDEGDVHLEMLYFTGEVFEGERTRVFAYLRPAARIRGKTPRHSAHSRRRPNRQRRLGALWARRGYASLSFDFCGDTNLPSLGPEYRRERYTLWGKVPANMMQVGGGRSMTPTPRHNPWFHWALAARRGLTLLESSPQVDGDRLGIFGISVGGTLTWIVAAVDDRVKAAVPIYGCGWESYNTFPPEPEPQVDEETRLWRTLLAPEAHAPRIQCPVLFMSATNDFHGKMDLGYRTLDLLASPVRSQVFTPNYDHHIEPAEAKSLPLWMDAHLRCQSKTWPETPQISFIGVASGGVPQIRVVPANERDVNRVDLYYSLSTDWPMGRFWRTIGDVRHDGDEFIGAAPFVDASDTLYALANVTYSSGVRISSPLAVKRAGELPGARPTLVRQTLIDSLETATDWNWVPAYTDPNQADTAFFAEWRGAEGERGFTLDPTMFRRDQPMSFDFGTRKIGDPQFRGLGEATLVVDCLAANLPEKLTARVRHRRPAEFSQEFEATLLPESAAESLAGARAADGAWRTLRMKHSQFHSAQGNALPDWEHADYFTLQGVTPAGHPPVFKRLRWE